MVWIFFKAFPLEIHDFKKNIQRYLHKNSRSMILLVFFIANKTPPQPNKTLTKTERIVTGLLRGTRLNN